LPHTGQAPFPELLRRKVGISLHVLSDRLDQLATQVAGQACVLHLLGYVLDPLCSPAKDGFRAGAQFVLQSVVQVSALAGGLDGPGQALADLLAWNAALGRDAQRNCLSHAQALFGREVGRRLSGDERPSRIGLLLDHLFDELRIEGTVWQERGASLLLPLARLLVSGPGQIEGSVLDVG